MVSKEFFLLRYHSASCPISASDCCQPISARDYPRENPFGPQSGLVLEPFTSPRVGHSCTLSPHLQHTLLYTEKMAAFVASNLAVAAPVKVAARKISARKAVALPGEFIPFPPARLHKIYFFPSFVNNPVPLTGDPITPRRRVIFVVGGILISSLALDRFIPTTCTDREPPFHTFPSRARSEARRGCEGCAPPAGGCRQVRRGEGIKKSRARLVEGLVPVCQWDNPDRIAN